MNYDALRQKIRDRMEYLKNLSLETKDPDWGVSLLLAQIELGNILNETWKMESEGYTVHPTLSGNYDVDPGDED